MNGRCIGARSLTGFDLFEVDELGLDEARLTQASLVETQEHTGAVLEALPVGLLIHTRQGIVYANAMATKLLRSSCTTLRGQHLLDHVAPEDAGNLDRTLQLAFKNRSTLTAEAAIERPDGSRRIANIILGRLPWPGTPVLQVILQDVTDQKKAEASLRALTITDELTGAYNRRHAFYEASLYMDRCGGSPLPFSILMLDIDHFKHVNDTYGHAAGDAALVSLARLVQGLLPSFREADSAMFARLGGEEFLVLLPGVRQRSARAIAERLRRAIEANQVIVDHTHPPLSFGFTTSFGVATLRTSDAKFDALLCRADAALYKAKENGRNQVAVAE